MGRPKALLDYRGETFAGRLARMLGEVCDPVIMVLGHHHELLRPKLPVGVRYVVNPDPERGQLSSLQIAMAGVPRDAEGFFFLPVDCPAVQTATLDRLAQKFRSRAAGTQFVIPQFHGKHGHPVCGTREVIAEFLSLPPATGQAREIIHRHVAQTEYVDVDDAGILADIDDPIAYRQLAEQAQQ